MMDEEILKSVQAVLGKDIEIVDCQQTKTVQEEEILFINGKRVKLEGSDVATIKKAMLTGEIPPGDLLNQLLIQAGILRKPVQLETSLSVKSTLTTTEEVRVARNGKLLNEHLCQTKEDNYYSSVCNEVWEPIGKTNPAKTAHCATTNDEISPSLDGDHSLDYVKRNRSSSSQIPPMRQNSVCTNDSIYSSSASSSSRPTSELSVNISNSDMNLFDNIQSYLTSHQTASAAAAVEVDSTPTKLNQSSSCDSGHHDYSISRSTTVNDEDFRIPSTATQSSISTQSSRSSSTTTATSNSNSSIDDVDFQRCRISRASSSGGDSSIVKLKPQNYLVKQTRSSLPSINLSQSSRDVCFTRVCRAGSSDWLVHGRAQLRL